jgi:nitrogen fixation-related uncharacterized protein
MSSFRPLLFAITIFAFIAGIVFIFQNQKTEVSKQAQYDDLKSGFSEFLADRLRNEKKGSRLLKTDILSIKSIGEGSVKVAYSILFDEMLGGVLTPSSVEATATLRHEKEVWRVISISTKKESVDF